MMNPFRETLIDRLAMTILGVFLAMMTAFVLIVFWALMNQPEPVVHQPRPIYPDLAICDSKPSTLWDCLRNDLPATIVARAEN